MIFGNMSTFKQYLIEEHSAGTIRFLSSSKLCVINYKGILSLCEDLCYNLNMEKLRKNR